MVRRVWRGLGVLGLLLLCAGLWAGWTYQRFLDRPLAVDRPVDYQLHSGTGYGQMVADLRRRGWTDAGWPWRVLGLVSGQAQRLQAGEYRLMPGTTPQNWIDKLARGEVLLHRFTIVEGWTASELRARLRAHPAIRTDSALDDATLADHLDISALEGWFLPETYWFPRDTEELEVLRRAHRSMREALEEVWALRDPGLPVETPYQVLILASIIEKETGLAEERGRIAGVFVRRLMRGMRLQTDPTVIYGIGERFDGDLRRADLRRDTPYNTYTRKGLPPTPIALPGRAALLAAVRPEPGEALYFVARGDGSHEFSATLEQHEQAVDRYQRGLGREP